MKKKRIMDLMENLVYSRSQKNYDFYYEKLKTSMPDDLILYFDENWHQIQDQWVRFKMHAFGNYTNNRLEGGVNALIKKFVGVNMTLFKFIDEFFRWYQNTNKNLDYNTGQRTLRKPVVIFSDPCLNAYRHLLSEYAFEKFLPEYENRTPLTLKDKDSVLGTCRVIFYEDELRVSTECCTCTFFQIHSMPCRHILACRNEFKLDVFAPHLCHSHWVKSKKAVILHQEKKENKIVQNRTKNYGEEIYRQHCKYGFSSSRRALRQHP